MVLIIMSSCGSASKIKDGLTAYRFKKYNKAIGLLKEEYTNSRRQDIRAEKAYYLGESFLKLNDYHKANEWFQTSTRLAYGAKALQGLAKTFKNLEQYDKAVSTYEELKKLMPGDQSIQREIFICNQAMTWTASKVTDHSIIQLIQNGMYSDYSPALYEGKWLVFTSDMEEATGSARYDWTGKKMSDLFIINKKGGDKIQRFDAYINSSHNDGTAVFTKDFNQMYFTRCFNSESVGDEYCKLMVSIRQEGIWNEPTLLPFIKPNTNYGQPALIENDSVLVYSSISEDGANGFDLWYSVLDADGWSAPYPMPSSINSPGNEYFPTSDGDTLYFSSNYLPGMGGLDIFKTYLNNDGTWATPVNLQLPYNSGADDFGLLIDRTKDQEAFIYQKGYISSTRSNEGHEDIYYYELYKSGEDEVATTKPKEDESKSNKADLYLAGKVLEEVFKIENDPNSGVKSKVGIPSPYIKVLDQDGNDLEITANKRGLFIGNLTKGEQYIIQVKKQGYLNNEVAINTNDYDIGNENSYTINTEIILEKIFKGQEIVLSNIYYDLDKDFIRDDAKPTLDLLADKLIQNPQISIELSSHTDCQGDADYNLDLSQRRAQSAVQYLIAKGISKDRLAAKGYGKTQLLDNCPCDDCTADQHQKNRRTAFTIL